MLRDYLWSIIFRVWWEWIGECKAWLLCVMSVSILSWTKRPFMKCTLQQQLMTVFPVIVKTKWYYGVCWSVWDLHKALSGSILIETRILFLKKEKEKANLCRAILWALSRLHNLRVIDIARKGECLVLNGSINICIRVIIVTWLQCFEFMVRT